MLLRYLPRALLVCALIFCSHSARGQELPNLIADSKSSVKAADVSVLPIDRQVKSGRLENGLTYYIRQDNRFERTHVELVVNAGEGEEEKDQIGLAHLLEHLGFSFSDEFPNQKWREFVFKYKMEPGRDYNASTGRATRYWVKVPGGSAASLVEAFGIERGWLDQMVLTESRINLERPVVLSEFRTSDNSRELIVHQELQYRLLDSPEYNVNFRSIHDANIEVAKLDALKRFYEDWYRPDLAAVIVVGPVDVAEAEQLLRTEFSSVKPKHSAPAKGDAGRRLKVELTGRSQYLSKFDARLAGVRYATYRKRPARSDGRRSVVDMRYALVDSVINLLLQSRVEEAVSTAELGCVPYAALNPFWNSLTRIEALEASVACKDGSGARASLERLQLALDQMMTYGFSSKEMAKAKALLKESKLSGPRTQGAQVEVLADNFLHGTPIVAVDNLDSIEEALLSAISAQEVTQRLRYFRDTAKDFDILATGNEKYQGQALSKSEVNAVLLQQPNKSVPRYVAIEPPAAILIPAQRDRLPVTKIATDSWMDELGVRKVTLANGVTIYFVDNDGPASGRVSIWGFRPFRCDKRDRAACDDVSALVRSADLAGFSSKQVAVYKKAKEINLSVAVDQNRTGIAVVEAAAPRSNWENALQLTYLTLTSLRPNEPSFQDIKREIRYAEPDEDFVVAIDRRLRDERLGLEEDHVQADLTMQGMPSDFESASTVFNSSLRSDNDLTVVINGPLNLDDAVPLAARYFGALPSTESAPMPFAGSQERFDNRPMQQRIELPAAIAATMTQKGYARIYSGGVFTDTLVNRIELELLGSILQQAVHASLREHGGGVYAPGAMIEIIRSQPGQSTGSYRVAITFSADPSQLDRLAEAARRLLAELKEKGVPQAFVDQALAKAPTGTFGWEGATRHIRWSLSRGEDPTEILKRQSILSLMSKRTIDRAARQYLMADNLRVTLIAPRQAE